MWQIPELGVALSVSISWSPSSTILNEMVCTYDILFFRNPLKSIFIREEGPDIPTQSKFGHRQVRYSHTCLNKLTDPTVRYHDRSKRWLVDTACQLEKQHCNRFCRNIRRGLRCVYNQRGQRGMCLPFRSSDVTADGVV